MNNNDFSEIVKRQMAYCSDLLLKKGEEYSSETDRLSHFKRSAKFMGVDPKEALLGMAVKHWTSVADMCTSGKEYPKDLWEEKITDSINYLLILRALIDERAN